MTRRIPVAVLGAAAAFSTTLIASQAVHAQVGMPAVNEQASRVERFERQLEQIQRDTRVRANPDLPASQRMLIDYGAAITLGFAAIDDAQQETHILRNYSAVGYLRADLDGVHQVFLRASTAYRDWNEGDDLDNHGDDWVEPQIDRAIYSFDMQRYLARYEGEIVDWNIQAQVGRQLIHWANGLVLSEEIDGGTVTFSLPDVSVQVLAGVTRESVVDIDSSRPDFDGDTERGFYGALITAQTGDKHQPYIYGLVQDDQNDRQTRTDTIGGVPVTTAFTYGSWYVGGGSQGRLSDQLLYGAEIVYQGGEGLSSSFTNTGGVITAVPQTEEDIEAFALDFRLDYLLQDDNHSRLSAEFLYASGDDDRGHTTNTLGGNQPGTDDEAFNAFGLINTGLAFAPNASNLVMVRGGASTFPLPSDPTFSRLQVGINGFGFWKADENAPIDEFTTNNSWLGLEADLYANWQVTSDLSMALRYGVFFPGDAIVDRDERHFFYSGVTLAF